MHLRQENQKIREICKGVLKALGGWVRQSVVPASPLAGWLAGWLVGWLASLPAGWLNGLPACLRAHLPACLPACMPACLAGWPAGWLASRTADWPAGPSHLVPTVTSMPPNRAQESNLDARQDRPAIAAPLEIPATHGWRRCTSGMLWGGAVLQSMPVGAQTGWIRAISVDGHYNDQLCWSFVGIEDL